MGPSDEVAKSNNASLLPSGWLIDSLPLPAGPPWCGSAEACDVLESDCPSRTHPVATLDAFMITIGIDPHKSTLTAVGLSLEGPSWPPPGCR
jgi:hypothetical protein